MKTQAPVDKALEVLGGLGLARTSGSSQPLPFPLSPCSECPALSILRDIQTITEKLETKNSHQ